MDLEKFCSRFLSFGYSRRTHPESAWLHPRALRNPALYDGAKIRRSNFSRCEKQLRKETTTHERRLKNFMVVKDAKMEKAPMNVSAGRSRSPRYKNAKIVRDSKTGKAPMKVSADRSRFGKGALNSSADRCRSPRYKNAKVVKDAKISKGLMKDSADRSRSPPAIATIRVCLAAAVCSGDVPVELRNHQGMTRMA